jgi:hypothetical protein
LRIFDVFDSRLQIPDTRLQMGRSVPGLSDGKKRVIDNPLVAGLPMVSGQNTHICNPEICSLQS